MTSTNHLDILTPSPCPHFELINTIKFTQPPLLRLLLHNPLPLLMRTSYLDAPQVYRETSDSVNSARERDSSQVFCSLT